MRWDLIDTFDVLKKGQVSLARKSFKGTEDFFAEHDLNHPRVPEPFFVEMIAQAGGVLFGMEIDFKKEVVLAKVENVVFFQSVEPPCTLTVEARLAEVREDGAWIFGSVRQAQTLIAEAKIMLAAVESLVEGQNGKVIFSEKFLKDYRIKDVVKKSEAVGL